MKRYARKVAFYLAPAIIAGVVLGAIGCVSLLCEYADGHPANLYEILKELSFMLAAPLAAYGVFCVAYPHPICREGYFEWLRTTPYDGRRPLPYGPVGAHFKELVNVGLIAFMSIVLTDKSASQAIWFTGMAFMIPHIMAAAALLRLTRKNVASRLLILGLALIFAFLSGAPWFAFGLALLSLSGSLRALDKSLKDFPWEEKAIQSTILVEYNNRKPTLDDSWPYGSLEPDKKYASQSKWDGWAAAALIAGLYLTSSKFKDGDLFYIFVLILPVCAGAGLRLLDYIRGIRPPISILGRIATGRLLIPAYDKVFAAPLLGLMVPLVGIGVSYLLGYGKYCGYYAPILFGLAALILFNMGPGLEEWRLTAPARLVPPRSARRFSQ